MVTIHSFLNLEANLIDLRELICTTRNIENKYLSQNLWQRSS
jgi:hypothetical protein